jgi:hypothetical protein
VQTTAYLWPDDPFFAYPEQPLPPVVPPPKERHPGRVAAVLGAVTMGTASGVCLGLASAETGRWSASATPEEANPHRERINTLVVTSGVTGALGAGLALGAAISVAW